MYWQTLTALYWPAPGSGASQTWRGKASWRSATRQSSWWPRSGGGNWKCQENCDNELCKSKQEVSNVNVNPQCRQDQEHSEVNLDNHVKITIREKYNWLAGKRKYLVILCVCCKCETWSIRRVKLVEIGTIYSLTMVCREMSQPEFLDDCPPRWPACKIPSHGSWTFLRVWVLEWWWRWSDTTDGLTRVLFPINSCQMKNAMFLSMTCIKFWQLPLNVMFLGTSLMSSSTT